jgi:hypothetical protein
LKKPKAALEGAGNLEHKFIEIRLMSIVANNPSFLADLKALLGEGEGSPNWQNLGTMSIGINYRSELQNICLFQEGDYWILGSAQSELKMF